MDDDNLQELRERRFQGIIDEWPDVYRNPRCVTHDHLRKHSGKQIKGSDYYRRYCYHCKEPMRVQLCDVSKPIVYCTDCFGVPPGPYFRITERQRIKLRDSGNS